MTIIEEKSQSISWQFDVVSNHNKDMNSNNSIPELQSPFEQLREVDADGKEWWNSRKLARE